MITYLAATLALTVLAALWLVAQFGVLVAMVVIYIALAFIIGSIVAFVSYARSLYRPRTAVPRSQ